MNFWPISFFSSILNSHFWYVCVCARALACVCVCVDLALPEINNTAYCECSTSRLTREMHACVSARNVCVRCWLFRSACVSYPPLLPPLVPVVSVCGLWNGCSLLLWLLPSCICVLWMVRGLRHDYYLWIESLRRTQNFMKYKINIKTEIHKWT